MTFRLQWPTQSRYITQNFLANYDYYMRWNIPGHEGIDIGTQVGDEIYASADGVVFFVNLDPSHNYGIHLAIQHKHPQGIYKTYYAHLQEVRVEVGERVKAGDLIGLAGITGQTSGNHLHFMLEKNGATEAGETRFYNERRQEVVMPNDMIDPTPFLDPQPKSIPARPILQNHPAAPLLGSKSPYIPNKTADLLTTQPIALRLPEKVVLEFIYPEGISRFQLNKGATITIHAPVPQKGDPNLQVQENGRSVDLILSENVQITFSESLPWEGDTLQVDADAGAAVMSNATASSKEIARLPMGFQVVVTTFPREAGSFVWRQITAPENFEGLKIRGMWVAERTIDGLISYLISP